MESRGLARSVVALLPLKRLRLPAYRHTCRRARNFILDPNLHAANTMDERLTPEVPHGSALTPVGAPVLAVELTRGLVAGEGSARRSRLFHRALSIGIAMFDLTSSSTPVLDARLIGESNREFHRTLTLIVPARAQERSRPEGIVRAHARDSAEAESSPPSEPTLLQELGSVTRPEDRLWVEIAPEYSDSTSISELTAGLPIQLGDAKVSWVVRWETPDQLDLALQRTRRLGEAIVTGPASLLDPRGPAAVAAISPSGTRRYLARDPFAGGRLDGSLLEAGNLDRSPNDGPTSIERLQEAYRPVLAFGFLALRGVRNLRVAALQYLLTLPSVVGVVVPISTEPQLVELGQLPSAPPLEPADLERIAQLQTGRRSG